MYLADSLAFFRPAFELNPVPDPAVRLDLAHLTSAPPVAPKGTPYSMEFVLGVHTRYMKTAEMQPDLVVVTSWRELRTTEKTRVILGLQTLPDDADIGDLRSAGVRVVNIAGYDQPNAFGGGFAAPAASLTERGMEALYQCAELGMIVDLSHASHRTAWEILDFVEKKGIPVPVCATHSGCSAVFDHGRNLPDPILKKIAAGGGFVGIPTVTFFLDARNDTVEPFVRHVAHAIEVCGEGAVAVGSDGVYRTQEESKWREEFARMSGLLAKGSGSFNARFPDQPFDLNCPERMERIVESLYRGGIPKRAVEKVAGRNLLQFFSSALI